MSDERTLFRGSSSLIVNASTFFLCGLLLIAAVVFGFLTQPPVNFALFGLAGVAFLYALGQWILIKIRVYEVTTERLRVTTGLVTRRTDELELYRVVDVTFIEPLTQRLFGCGTIAMSTNDASTPSVELKAIRGARALREELRKSIETCRDRKRVRLTEME